MDAIHFICKKTKKKDPKVSFIYVKSTETKI